MPREALGERWQISTPSTRKPSACARSINPPVPQPISSKRGARLRFKREQGAACEQVAVNVRHHLLVHAGEVLVLALLTVVFIQVSDRLMGVFVVQVDVAADAAAQDLTPVHLKEQDPPDAMRRPGKR